MGNTISVIVGHNTDRHQKLYPDTATLREIFEDQGIDYGRGMTMLDGTTVTNLDMSLADYGKTSRATLFSISKTD